MLTTLVPKLLQHRTLAVFSHIRPDGDALGSQIGFCLWLQLHGIQAHAYNENQFPDYLQWLSDFYPIVEPRHLDPKDYDVVVFLDGNQPNRFGDMAESLATSGLPLYMIDHHPDPMEIYTDQLWSTQACSTAELVVQLYQQTGLERMSRNAAIALYTGMVTDTGSFRFDSVTPQTHRTAAELLEIGKFKPNLVHERIYDTKTFAQYKLLALAIDTMQFHGDGRIGTICVTQAMFDQTGTDYQDIDSFVSYPLSVKGVEASVIFVELEGRIKLSFRSKSKLDVNQWARHFEGGGHSKAAGGWTQGPLTEAIDRVLSYGLLALTTVP